VWIDIDDAGLHCGDDKSNGDRCREAHGVVLMALTMGRSSWVTPLEIAQGKE